VTIYLLKRGSNELLEMANGILQIQRRRIAQSLSVFNNIAKVNLSKNWEISQVGREIDNAFKVQAKGRIPDWAEPIIEYGKAVE
jgi:hypothetical protein